jgi:hypothetical protein
LGKDRAKKTKKLERHMTNAPEWIWQLLSFLCICAGIVIVILYEPIYLRLKSPKTAPFLSTLIISISVAILFGSMWWFFVVQGKANTKKQKAEEKSIIEPELVLLSPEKKQRYLWIPKKSIHIQQGIDPRHGIHGNPIFGLKNLSNAPVTGITIEWTINESMSADLIFLTNKHFHKYNPKIDGDTFWLYNKKPLDKTAGTGTGMSVSDFATATISLLEMKALEVPLPPPIANSFTLRIIASSQRPTASNVPKGFIKSKGPTVYTVVKYKQSGKKHIGHFKIESSVITFSNTSSDDLKAGEWSGMEPKYWSEDNFRATVTFNVVQSLLCS